MIIGFGFGDPLTSLLMLLVTSGLSYMIFKAFRSQRERGRNEEERREELRRYYTIQRERAREMMKEFDISDEEIEERIDRELKP